MTTELVLFSWALAVGAVAATRGLWSPCGLSMLTSLNPVAERGRGHRFAVTAGWYVAGAVVGGALLGGVLAGLAAIVGGLPLSSTVRLGFGAGVALLGVVSDLRPFGWSLPDHPRQVNERWLSRYRRWLYASGFGVQIGSGFATYIMTAAVYTTASLAVFTGAPMLALLAGVSFGAVRGLSILVIAGCRTPERLLHRSATIDRLGGAALSLAVAVQVAAAVGLAAAINRPVGLLAAVAVVAVVVVAGALTIARLRSRRSLALP
jgi:MFS family permease